MQHEIQPPPQPSPNRRNNDLEMEYQSMKRMMMTMAVMVGDEETPWSLQQHSQHQHGNDNDDDGDNDDDDSNGDSFEWIICYVHPQLLLSSSNSCSNHGVQTKFLLPIRRKRILSKKDGMLMKGTYFVMPEKKAAAVAAGASSSSSSPSSSSCLFHRYTTVMHLMRHGLEGVLAPCSPGDAGKDECESAVPFFLKDLAVAGIYINSHNHKLTGLSNAASASNQQQKQPMKRKRTPSSPAQQQSNAQKQQFHPVKAPSFENICGSVFAGMMNPVSIPPIHYRRTNDSGNAMAVGIGSAAAAAGRGGAAGGSVQRRGRKKQPWFMAMRGTEIFTVHGNLVLKKRNCGTSIKFMGFKDTGHLFSILRIIFSFQSQPSSLSTCSSQTDGFMDLMAHMAILTANLGKRLSVDQSCLLRHMLVQIPCVQKKHHPRRTAIDFSTRTEEDCNAEIFSIVDWQAVHAFAKQADGYGKSKVVAPGSVQLDDSELDELTNGCCCCFCSEGSSSGEKKEEEELRRWNNTITVTAKGAVILRFSWSRPMPWTERHTNMALAASNLACRLIECCC